nr:YcaO-like family protein [uncultured Gellertiella sp.]
MTRFGITRLSRLTGLDRLGIPVWNAVMPNARSIVINQGKGIRDIDAKVSAAMESLERAVAADPPLTPRLATAAQLRAEGENPQKLPALIGASASDIHKDEMIAWVDGVDLLTEKRVMVPFDAVVLDRVTDDHRFWQSSDGLASGNTAAEARFHGLLERIERDAETLWYLRKPEDRARTRFDPGEFRDPVLDGLLQRVRAAGLTTVFFDMRSDNGIPCIMVFLAAADIRHRRAARQTDVTAGSGAHPSALRAAIRALTEAAQSRMTYISGARDDIDPAVFERPLAADILESFIAEPGPFPQWGLDAGGLTGQTGGLTGQTGGLTGQTGGLAGMMEQCLDALKRTGCGLICSVAMSAPDWPFAVEKVLVPDLENPEGNRLRPYGLRALRQVLAR